MLTKGQKAAIVEFAEKRLSENDKYHRMAHVTETADIAVELAKKEHADADVCWTAAMLHDIRKSKPGDHAADGAKQAKKFLLDLGLPAGFAELVADVIHHHNKDFNDGPIERGILWDSDKLPLVTPDGFKNRMTPYWIGKLGETEGKKKATEEYFFYYQRFHTATAKKKIMEYRKQMELLLPL